MLVRRLFIIVLLVLLGSSLWAKEKVNLKGLMAKSDALYYCPSLHGLTDLAVDMAIDKLADNPISKAATVTYYYAGDTRQRITVSNVPDKYADFRNSVIDLVSPLGQYIIPLPTSASFNGMTLSLEKASREILGVKETEFYVIVGKPTAKKSTVKEYRLLIDKDGLLHQIENVTGDDSDQNLVALVENIHLGDGWHVSDMTTRLSKEGVWKIEHIDYDVIEGFTLPVRYSVRYRNTLNQPVKEMGDMNLAFQNYRINKGVAAAAFAASPDTEPVPPATAPAPVTAPTTPATAPTTPAASAAPAAAPTTPAITPAPPTAAPITPAASTTPTTEPAPPAIAPAPPTAKP